MYPTLQASSSSDSPHLCCCRHTEQLKSPQNIVSSKRNWLDVSFVATQLLSVMSMNLIGNSLTKSLEQASASTASANLIWDYLSIYGNIVWEEMYGWVACCACSLEMGSIWWLHPIGFPAINRIPLYVYGRSCTVIRSASTLTPRAGCGFQLGCWHCLGF